MRIEQAYVSPSLSHFRYEFLECWDLREYDNPEEPAVFYGLYYDWDNDNNVRSYIYRNSLTKEQRPLTKAQYDDINYRITER